MISVTNVSKRYGDLYATRDVSFSIGTGEIVGLVGPNGAGKTTTMKMVTGYIVPTSGTITIDGDDVASNPLAAQRRIGYLPEHNPLYTDMPVQDYLVFIGRMRGLSGKPLLERLEFVADCCGLRSELTRPIRHLSKGFRQRVGIGQAIIHDPEILILDEPTSGLDPNQIVEIRDLIRRLGEQKTVILSTHILSEVEETCTRAIIIVSGRIGCDDTIENLVGGRNVQITFDGGGDDAEQKIRSIEGVASVAPSSLGSPGSRSFRVTPKESANINNAIHNLAVSEGWSVSELATERQSLESIFRDVSREAVVQ